MQNALNYQEIISWCPVGTLLLAGNSKGKKRWEKSIFLILSGKAINLYTSLLNRPEHKAFKDNYIKYTNIALIAPK